MHTGQIRGATGLTSTYGHIDFGKPVGVGPQWYPAFNIAGTTSGVVVGEAGSGYTHLTSLIALGIRAAMPTVTVVLGPHADEDLPDVAHHATRVAATPRHSTALLQDLTQLVRRRRLQASADAGARHHPALPYILIVANRPREVFAPTQAPAWSDLLRIGRKHGVALLAAGDGADGPDFAGHGGLQSSVNTYIGMRNPTHPPAFGTDAPRLSTLPPGLAIVRVGLDRPWYFYDVPAVSHLDELLATYPDAATNEL